ncbi:MAG: 3-hydroxyacyl-ACP dehydratase FabZ family protein [Gemmataceae bacterium]
MRPELFLDPTKLDFSKILASREDFRKANPQRFEMEQIDAIVYIDREKHIIAGYKDVRPDEFWVRGHMPNFPLLPGVLMCESAAQMLSYYIATVGLKQSDFIAFGGMDNIRFRGVVRPGDSFVLVGKAIKLNRRQTIFSVQGFVGSSLVFHGDIIGVQFHAKDAGMVSQES